MVHNIRFVDGAGKSLQMGHAVSDYKLTKVSGIDGIEVDITKSQGFDQIGVSVGNMAVEERVIGVIGRIDNFAPDHLRRIQNMFLPLSTVRVYFEEKYWIDAVVKETPVFSYKLRTVKFSVELMAPYPFWKKKDKNFYRLGGLTGGFNFPASYDIPHNFALFPEILFTNCKNNGNTKVDFKATITAFSGTADGVKLINAANQKYLVVDTEITAADTVEIFRENNILRVTKTTGGVTTDIFSAFDEESTLFYMDVGDNVIRADATGGDAVLVVTIEFYDTLAGVRYGV